MFEGDIFVLEEPIFAKFQEMRIEKVCTIKERYSNNCFIPTGLFYSRKVVTLLLQRFQRKRVREEVIRFLEFR